MRCEINAWRDRWGGLGPDRWVAWVLSRVGGGGGGWVGSTVQGGHRDLEQLPKAQRVHAF